MNIDLIKVFENKYVKSAINNKNIKIYKCKEFPFVYNNFIINELIYYLTSEGFNNIIKKYDCGIIEGIEKLIKENKFSNNKFIKNIIDILFNKYVNENEIKCIWVVIPKDTYNKLVDKYRVVKSYKSIIIISKSFRIKIYYISKYNGKDVYIGQVVCDGGYYKLYKDYLNLGDRVLCDDNWLTGRLFYGIKSDMFYVNRKLKQLKRNIFKLKNK